MPAQTFRLAVIAGRQIEAADAVAMTVLLREIHVGAGIVGRYQNQGRSDSVAPARRPERITVDVHVTQRVVNGSATATVLCIQDDHDDLTSVLNR